MTEDAKFDMILSALTVLTDKVNVMDGKITEMDGKITEMNGKITEMDGKITEMDGKITEMDGKITEMDDRLKKVEAEQTRINLIIENDIRHNINIIVENYEPAAKAFTAHLEELGEIKGDVRLIKPILAEHSRMLSELMETA